MHDRVAASLDGGAQDVGQDAGGAACPHRFKVIHRPPGGKDRWTIDDALRHAGRTANTPDPEDSEETLRKVRRLLREDEVAAAAVNEMVIHRPGIAEKVMTNRDTRFAILWGSKTEFGV